jgi:hypothetical protein
VVKYDAASVAGRPGRFSVVFATRTKGAARTSPHNKNARMTTHQHRIPSDFLHVSILHAPHWILRTAYFILHTA